MVSNLQTDKDLIKRFRADAQGLLECQKLLKTKGLSHDTLARCKPLISEMPSVRCPRFSTDGRCSS